MPEFDMKNALIEINNALTEYAKHRENEKNRKNEKDEKNRKNEKDEKNRKNEKDEKDEKDVINVINVTNKRNIEIIVGNRIEGINEAIKLKNIAKNHNINFFITSLCDLFKSLKEGKDDFQIKKLSISTIKAVYNAFVFELENDYFTLKEIRKTTEDLNELGTIIEQIGLSKSDKKRYNFSGYSNSYLDEYSAKAKAKEEEEEKNSQNNPGVNNGLKQPLIPKKEHKNSRNLEHTLRLIGEIQNITGSTLFISNVTSLAFKPGNLQKSLNKSLAGYLKAVEFANRQLTNIRKQLKNYGSEKTSCFPRFFNKEPMLRQKEEFLKKILEADEKLLSQSSEQIKVEYPQAFRRYHIGGDKGSNTEKAFSQLADAYRNLKEIMTEINQPEADEIKSPKILK